jgi:hypothetical protein
LNWKWLPLATLLAGGALCAGCSGIDTSGSISPATFLLPGFGFGQTQPPAPMPEQPDAIAEVSPAHAQTN